MDDIIPCTPKSLHPFHWKDAAETAKRINPANAIATAGLGILPPEHIAMLTGRYWGAAGAHLTVQALEDCPAPLWGKIIDHANAWGQYGNVSFDTVQSGGQVRVAFQNTGLWSYLGTDILHIPANEQTMNLQGFNAEGQPESEYNRVVKHEFAHSLGCPHEHARAEIVNLLDPAKVYAYFEATQGWSQSEIDAQILTPLEQSSIIGTPVDVDSIMCYSFPGSLTKSGRPIPGGLDIDPSDGAFIAKVYPKTATPAPAPPMLDAAKLKLVLDGIFLFVENQVGPWSQRAMEAIRAMADQEIQAIWNYLHSQGIV